MSRPPNPLAKFRTYSYYHVLVVCDSSETADQLAKQTKPEKWLHPTGPDGTLGQYDTFARLGPYAVQYLNKNDKSGRYCILINGATDAAFSIARAKWTSVTAAAATMMDQSTSIAIEGELEVSEPKGVVFLDIIVQCCLAMGIDASNAVFMLKTFFVGHADREDVPATEYYLTDIEPLRFIAYSVTGSFAETGGLYLMSFVAITHGASRLPQFGKAASGFNISGGNSLKEAFENLAGVVNQNYDRLYACIEQSVEEDELKELITRVNYKFNLDDAYFDDKYKVSDGAMYLKDKSGCFRESKVNIPANMSIEDAIHIIMRKCEQVHNDMVHGVTDDNGTTVHYEYKVHSTIQSVRGSGSGPDNDKNKIYHTVIYCIRRFMRPKDAALFAAAAKDIGVSLDPDVPENDLTQLTDQNKINKLSPELRQLRNNLIGFDYIYTGKNVDILEFDMQMNLGIAYLQIATITNTLKDNLQAVGTAVQHMPQYSRDQATRWGKPTQIPIFFGTQIRSPSWRNKLNATQAADAGYTLSKHASIEVQDVTMRIHGNPRLLGTVNRTTSPNNICGAPPPPQNDIGRDADFRDWGSYPSFAKVNIKMPRNNDDISLFKGESVINTEQNLLSGTGIADFTRDFWFTGFYYVVSIEHQFEGGEFTQQLSMIGIPTDKTTEILKKETETVQKTISKCYDDADPCNKGGNGGKGGKGTTGARSAVEQLGDLEAAASSAAVVPHSAAGSKSQEATNKADIDSVTGSINPDNVKGWKTASPEVKSCIKRASEKHGVDLGFMVAMASKETGGTFNPRAHNTGTDARGLYQFLRSTWHGSSPGTGVKNQWGKQLGLEGKSYEEIDAARWDPCINAEAAALLAKQNADILKRKTGQTAVSATDLYLAHFMGPTDAAKLIGADQSADVGSVLGKRNGVSIRDGIVSKNPNYAKTQTVADWRTENAKGIGNQTPGIRVAQSSSTITAAPRSAAQRSQNTSTSRITPKAVGNIEASTNIAVQRKCPDKKKDPKKDVCFEDKAQAQTAALVAQTESTDPAVRSAARAQLRADQSDPGFIPSK